MDTSYRLPGWFLALIDANWERLSAGQRSLVIPSELTDRYRPPPLPPCCSLVDILWIAARRRPELIAASPDGREYVTTWRGYWRAWRPLRSRSRI